jgi:hypothetical protein
MTDTMTTQNIDLSSWDTLYISQQTIYYYLLKWQMYAKW